MEGWAGGGKGEIRMMGSIIGVSGLEEDARRKGLVREGIRALRYDPVTWPGNSWSIYVASVGDEWPHNVVEVRWAHNPLVL